MKKTAYNIIEGQNLTGKIFLITGGYTGLGAIHTRALLISNATVIISGRSAQTQAEFAKDLQEDPEINFEEHQLDASHTVDLGDLASVKAFASYIKSTYQSLDSLILNAGVMFTPPGKTKDGFETQMGINVIGHFLLAKMLVDITKRQVWLSSQGHIRFGAPGINYEAIKQVDEQTYVSRARYQQAKLGNILLAKEFAQRYPHMKAVSLHPGGVKTNLGRHMTLGQKLGMVLKHPLMILSMVEPEVGAATQTMLSILPDHELENGAYYSDCKVIEEAPSGKDMTDAKKLFDYCEEATKAFQV
ncbi:MAG: SDR family NAD(P)-dependent oxidoreductase [Cytophagales bacterium]|nr:SDR family NAD(P)-dependent oxidoreductase [Cytophagales bacterium]